MGRRGDKRTGLDLHPLRLVLDKGAQLGLVFVVEPVEVGLLDLWGVHG